MERAAERLRADGVAITPEKAKSQPPLSRARFRQPGDDGEAGGRASGTGAGPTAGQPAQPAPKRPHAPRVEIDASKLARHGLLTPTSMRSNLSEEVRLLKQDVINNFLEARAPRSNLVMVTSPNPGEGKTFNVLNLAISLACDPDFNILLVDADFARPQVCNYLGVPAREGLLDILANPARDLGDVILRTSIEHLSLIPAGEIRDNSVELLRSQRMLTLADELAERYPDRIVLFDSPPLLATVDPAVLAKRMGQVILVVEAERTERADIEQAIELLPEEAYLGLVLNKGSGFGASTYARHGYYRRTD